MLNGFELLDFKIINKNNLTVLEITIMKPGGFVSFNDCSLISKEVSQELDKEDYSDCFTHKYFLEVQSPGVSRVLKNSREYQLFKNYYVKVLTNVKYNDLGLEFIGKLYDVGDNFLELTDLELLPSPKNKKIKLECNSIKIELPHLQEVKLYDQKIPVL